MNQKQRDKIAALAAKLEDIKAEEDEKIDNMFDAFSGTEKYEQMEGTRDRLDEVIETLNEIAAGDQ